MFSNLISKILFAHSKQKKVVQGSLSVCPHTCNGWESIEKIDCSVDDIREFLEEIIESVINGWVLPGFTERDISKGVQVLIQMGKRHHIDEGLLNNLMKYLIDRERIYKND